MTGVGFYKWLCVCLCVFERVNGCSLAPMTAICIMDSQAILTIKDRRRRRGKDDGGGGGNKSSRVSLTLLGHPLALAGLGQDGQLYYFHQGSALASLLVTLFFFFFTQQTFFLGKHRCK